MKIRVKTIPNSKMNKVELVNGVYKVRLTVTPVDGKANKALIAILAKHFDVSKSSICILKGETSRDKIVKVED